VGDYEIQPHTSLALTKEAEGLLKFEQVEALSNFLKEVQWTPEVELQTILDIIMNAESDSIKLKAIKMLQDRRTDVLKNSGLMVKATKTQRDAEGNSTVFSAEVLASAFPQKKRSKQNARKQNTTNIPNTSDSADSPEEENTVVSTQSTATLHKPPTGSNVRNATGDDADTIGPECGGNLVPSSEDTEGTDTTGESVVGESEDILRPDECILDTESPVRESSGSSPEL
jgi:hypothetical protein